MSNKLQNVFELVTVVYVCTVFWVLMREAVLKRVCYAARKS